MVAADALLTKTLHTLTEEELGHVRRLADSLFANLTRPFRQDRVQWQFDFNATLRQALRTGHFLPTYARHATSHPKSKLVLAMSLSGIDRCYAVGLIPLLSELRKYLNFRLFIYTDTLQEAVFTEDGFLANDYKLAWNNVIAPVVFAQMSELHFDRQEEKLLLIDSLGGGDSEWYETWSTEKSRLAANAQEPFYGKNSEWTQAREWLAGRFERFSQIPRYLLPTDWEKKLLRNMKTRWVETPAMQAYLIRYIFHPDFGKWHHGKFDTELMRSFRDQNYPYTILCRASAPLRLLKEKFKSIHLLTPSFKPESQMVFDRLKKDGLIDFHHRANSLEGFGQMLVNIVYGRETDRLTVPQIRFGSIKGYEGIDDDKLGLVEDDRGGHSELVKTFKDCFANCDEPDQCMPLTTFNFSGRNRERTEVKSIPTPYSQIGLENGIFHQTLQRFPDWRVAKSWSLFSKIDEVNKVFDFVRTYEFKADSMYGTSIDLMRREYQTWPFHREPKYEKFHTRALKKHVDDLLPLFSRQYASSLNGLPLESVVWCSVGKFRHDLLAISACPSDEDDLKRATVWHECGHWAEHVCPAIGVYTNALLLYLTGCYEGLQKLVPVGVGEYAMPVRTGTGFRPWVRQYAGKWYRRKDTDLPNPTELLSVHLEYFRSPEALTVLLEHDPSMVKHVAFILMGGPLAILDTMRNARRRQALDEIEQRSRHGHGYERKSYSRSSSGGSGKNRQSSTPSSTPSVPTEERKSFGI